MKSQVKVLIAERTLGIAIHIAANLKAQGYEIAGIANSAEDAVELATITVPDIVLLDLPTSGQVDSLTAGWKILSEIQCPVVYMTTDDRDITKRETSVNPYGFLLKPFTPEELKTTIDQTLAHHRITTLSDRRVQTLEFDPHTDTERDQQLLTVLAAASAVTPMPRVLFVGDLLMVYTSTIDGAAAIKEACERCPAPFAYQIFAWRWKTEQYQLYAKN